MGHDYLNRRDFLRKSSIAVAGTTLTLGNVPIYANIVKQADKPAILGGQPVRSGGWHDWPVWDQAADDDILSILQSGNWWRGSGNTVEEFERQYADLMGSKRCLATASGTTALLTALNALGIEAGDEVLVAPYTFIATYNVVFMVKALPVFVDTDPKTFTMNPDKIEERITDRTKAILPVHIYGLPSEMDRINAIAKKHNLQVIEDACQAWLGEYQNKKCGTLGDLGCFSFQNSKNLPAGEGGAIVGDDEALMDRCWSYHNHGRPYGQIQGTYPINGSNYRMQQFQAAILLSQMKRIQADADKREANAHYLTQQIKDIPGIIPYELTEGATRSAFHIYPFRYKQEQFRGLPKEKFIAAMRKEGIPCGGGYHPQNKDGFIEEQLNSRSYQRLFSEKRLDQYRRENELPGNDQLCSEAVTLYQSMLLGTKQDMNDISDAITKIYDHAEELLTS